MLQHATTKTGSPTLCFMGLSVHLGIFLFCFVTMTCYRNKPGHNHISSVHSENHKREKDAEMKEVRPANVLQHFLNHFRTSYQWQIITNSPCLSSEGTKACTQGNPERATQWQKKPLRCVQSRHWQLKLPPAESSALAEWTWFNPCISCHGFPFSPQLWRERSLHAE